MLSNIEGKLADIIRNIVLTKTLPSKNTNEYYSLLMFVALTDLRNPVNIEGYKDSLNEIRKQILDIDPQSDIDNLFPNLNHDEIVQLHLANVFETVPIMFDLDYKLLINKTSKSFITSDLPIVRYNQYLELKKWKYSKCGYGLTGLQILIPINKELMVVLFDKDIYKIGNKKNRYLDITVEKNIDDLNKLQFLNCFGTIYFDDSVDESYIRKLHLLSKKHFRAHKTKSQLNILINEKDKANKQIIKEGFKNFMMIDKTECMTNLKIEGLKIHSNGNSHKLNDSLSQLRPYAEKLRYKGYI